MDRSITRRDFISGVGVAVTGSALAGPWMVSAAAGASGLQEETAYYPPAAAGMRGSHPGSFEVAHALRDGARWDDLGPEADTGERYDLVIPAEHYDGFREVNKKMHELAESWVVCRVNGTTGSPVAEADHNDKEVMR